MCSHLSITLARLAREFLDRPGLSKNTRDSYEFTLMPLLKEYGRWSVEIISRQELCDYLNRLTHIRLTTHHRHQAIIQALFNFAVEQGYLSIATAKAVRTPNVRHPQWHLVNNQTALVFYGFDSLTKTNIFQSSLSLENKAVSTIAHKKAL